MFLVCFAVMRQPYNFGEFVIIGSERTTSSGNRNQRMWVTILRSSSQYVITKQKQKNDYFKFYFNFIF